MPHDAALRLARQERNPIHEPDTRPAAEIAADYMQRIPAGRRGINLGCGGMTFKDWLNIDESQPHHCDIMCDLTKGLPFLPDGQFDLVYSEHFLEHISRKAAMDLLRECFRSLRSGGVMRIAMPCLDDIVKNYQGGSHFTEDTGEFAALYGPLRFTRGEYLNLAMRAWGHTYIYNYEDFSLMLKDIGFIDIRRETLNHSTIAMLADRENRPDGESKLIVEARKPD